MDALADFADRHPGNDATGLSPNECIDGGGESRDREEAEGEGQSKEARKGGRSQIFRRIKTSRPTAAAAAAQTKINVPGASVKDVCRPSRSLRLEENQTRRALQRVTILEGTAKEPFLRT